MTKRITALALAAALGAYAQAAAGQPDARDLFYELADPEADPADGWLGLRTSVELAYADRDGDERLRSVSDYEVFRSGDRIRLNVQANASGYLYVVLRSDRGEFELLFPSRGGGRNRIRPFRTRQVPEEEWFRFDRDTGREEVYLFLSRRSIRELERAGSSGGELDMRALERLLEGADGNPSRIFDEECGPTRPTFYAERPRARRQYIVRRFELEHR